MKEGYIMLRKITSVSVAVIMLIGLFLPQFVFADTNSSSNIKVRLTASSVVESGSHQITPRFSLYNEGTNSIDLSKIRIHYYFNLNAAENKAVPRSTKTFAKIYNKVAYRSNPEETSIDNLPFAFINMCEQKTADTDYYLEVGFPSNNTGIYYNSSSYLYKFLYGYWHNSFPDWRWTDMQTSYNGNSSANEGTLGWNYDNGNGNQKRFYWKNWYGWNATYIANNYSLNTNSRVDFELQIIKDIVGKVENEDVVRDFKTPFYSYNQGSQIDWDKITVYYDGQLVWGKEPAKALTAPTNLTGIADIDGIHLSWDNVPGASKYKVLRKGPKDSDYIELPAEISTNEFVDSNVGKGVKYSYKVRAISADNIAGPLSNEFSITTLNLSGNGVYAQYYNWKNVPNSTLDNYKYDLSNNYLTNYIISNTNLAMTRVDKVIDFDWKLGSPGTPVNSDYFTVVWNGYIMPKYSEAYTFHTIGDDGMRLYLDKNNNGIFEDEELIINGWKEQNVDTGRASSDAINLKKGQKYRFKLEYFERRDYALAHLFWSSPSQTKEVIPSSQLYVDSTQMIPNAPLNLRAEVLQDNRVKLDWEDVPNATSYNIYQVSKDGTTTIAGITSNTYNTVELKAGNYTYYVTACNDIGESERSDSAKASIGLQAPQNFAVNANGKQVDISWSSVVGADKYIIYRVSDGITTTFAAIGANTNSFIDKDVNWGAQYTYYVVASKNGFEGIPSDERSASIAPSMPDLTAKMGKDFVRLTWFAEGAESYKLERSNSLNGPFTEISSGITNESFDDKTINMSKDNGKVFFYKLTAISHGITSESNIAPITIHPGLDAPTNLTASVNNNIVKLQWNKVEDADGYVITRKTLNSDGTVAETKYMPSTTNSFNDYTAEWGKTYLYCVAAKKDGLEGLNSEYITVPIPLFAPALSAKQIDDFVRLEWQAKGATSYKLYRAESKESLENGDLSKYIIQSGISGDTKFYNDTSVSAIILNDSKTLYYKLIADSDGKQSVSNVTSVVVTPTHVTKIGKLKYNIMSDTKNFSVGSYIPAFIEIKFTQDVSDPQIEIQSKVEDPNDISKNDFEVSLLTKTKVYTIDGSGNIIGYLDKTLNGSNLTVGGNFKAGDVIRLEFITKLTATDEALDKRINDCYSTNQNNKYYNLKFKLQIGNDAAITEDNNGRPLQLPIKIVKGNKIN